jgi:hypothetical protein
VSIPFTDLDDRAISERLEALDAAGPREVKAVTTVGGIHSGGVFHSRLVSVADEGVPYLGKFTCHEGRLRGGHLLALELAIARLAHLFEPPLCPNYAVLAVDARSVDQIVCSVGQCTLALASGYAFGSRFLADGCPLGGSTLTHDAEVAHRVMAINPENAARIIVFQTWLEGETLGDKPEVLVNQLGHLYSVDHGAYLRSASKWWSHRDQGVPAYRPVVVSGLAEPARAGGRAAFEMAIAQLNSLSPAQIVDQFGGIPNEWCGSRQWRTKVAAYAVARKPLVESALEQFWRK